MCRARKEMSKEKSKRKFRQRPFPRDTLQEALKIAATIQSQNNGQPMKRIFIADYLKVKPSSSNFKYLLSSSYKYGLTEGTEKSEFISLTQLGSNIAKIEDKEPRIPFFQAALQKVQVFKDFYQRYRDAKLPSQEYARNLLKDEFNVPDERIDECLELIITNGGYAGLIQDVSGAPYVVFGKAPAILLEEEGEIEEERGEEEEEAPPSTLRAPAKPKQIFIAHGKNKTPLNQLKKILDKFKIPYKVAIEEPNVGRPISQKVAEVMRDCSSAIFIFTADEEVVGSEGNKTYRPSDNVVYELGAAGVLYGKSIVIFKEDSVTFATDFRDLGYITFEKDNLEAKATELLGELIGFGLLKITPA